MRLWALAAALACGPTGGLRGGCGPGACLEGRCYCPAPFSGPACATRAELPALVKSSEVEQLAAASTAVRAGAASSPTAAPAGYPWKPEARVRPARALTPDAPIPAGIRPQWWAREAEVAATLLLQDLDSPVVEYIETANHTARFVQYFLITVFVIVICVAASIFFKYHGEALRRTMFFVSGDTKMRLNVPDAAISLVTGGYMMPGQVIRIERIIVHDVNAGYFGLDLYIEVDWGTNMLQSTRVRQVQPVIQGGLVNRTVVAAQMPCPRGHALQPSSAGHECQRCRMPAFPGSHAKLTNTKKPAEFGCAACNFYVCYRHGEAPKPAENQTIFTDKLEFNYRPLGQDNMRITIKDQDIIGNELVGQLELDNEEVLNLAHRSVGKPLDLSTVGVYQISQNGMTTSGSKGSPTKLLIWFTLVDEYGERVMEA